MDLPALVTDSLRWRWRGWSKRRNWASWNRNEAYLDELHHFLDCVQTRRKPLVDLADGIASLRMALAAKESIATGRVIELELEGCARCSPMQTCST